MRINGIGSVTQKEVSSVLTKEALDCIKSGDMTWQAGMDYKQKIIGLINKTNNTELLELIYRFCKKLLG